MTTPFLAEAQELAEDLVAIRRDLHMHPELGFQEVRTARIVAEQLGAEALLENIVLRDASGRLTLVVLQDGITVHQKKELADRGWKRRWNGFLRIPTPSRKGCGLRMQSTTKKVGDSCCFSMRSTDRVIPGKNSAAALKEFSV